MTLRNISPGQLHDQFLVPYVKRPRIPTTADRINPDTGRTYIRPFIWIVGPSPASGTEGDLYYLASISSGSADWQLIATGDLGGGNLLMLAGDSATQVDADAGGKITFTGTTVANATRAKPLYIDDSGTNAMDWEIQVGAAVTGAPGDKNDAGVVSFDDTQFAVDGDGYTTLDGSVPQSFTTDSGTWTPSGNTATIQGSGCTVTASGATATVTVTGSGFTTDVETTTSSSIVANTVYVADNASLVTFTLPATCAVGDRFQIVGKGAGFWKVAQNASQTIHYLATDTTTGTGGSITSTEQYAAMEFLCTVANTDFTVINSVGNFTLV